MSWAWFSHVPACCGAASPFTLRSGTRANHGRAQSLLVVYNPQGVCLQRNARIVQLVFYRLTHETDGYHGTYQGENI